MSETAVITKIKEDGEKFYVDWKEKRVTPYSKKDKLNGGYISRPQCVHDRAKWWSMKIFGDSK